MPVVSLSKDGGEIRCDTLAWGFLCPQSFLFCPPDFSLFEKSLIPCLSSTFPFVRRASSYPKFPLEVEKVVNAW